MSWRGYLSLVFLIPFAGLSVLSVGGESCKGNVARAALAVVTGIPGTAIGIWENVHQKGQARIVRLSMLAAWVSFIVAYQSY